MKTAEEWVKQMGLSDSDLPTVRAIQADALRWAAEDVVRAMPNKCHESVYVIYRQADALERGE